MGVKRYEAKTLGEFIRKVAYDYVRYGYVFYAVRDIPDGKDLAIIDEKILAHYNVTYSRVTRLRRRRKGERSIAYVRYGRTFILLATEGRHPAFDRIVFFDLREGPVQFRGYTIGVRGGVPHVTVSKYRLREIVRDLKRVALEPEDRVRSLLKDVFRLRFPGIVRQEEKLLSHINERRRKAGRSRIRVEFGYRIPKKAA